MLALKRTLQVMRMLRMRREVMVKLCRAYKEKHIYSLVQIVCMYLYIYVYIYLCTCKDFIYIKKDIYLTIES